MNLGKKTLKTLDMLLVFNKNEVKTLYTNMNMNCNGGLRVWEDLHALIRLTTVVKMNLNTILYKFQ